MRKKILVRRASKGISGSIFEVGIAELDVVKVDLGTRLFQPFGNGCASDYIDRTEKTVDVVRVGSRDYLVQRLSFPHRYPDDVAGQVTIVLDEEVCFIEVVNPSRTNE